MDESSVFISQKCSVHNAPSTLSLYSSCPALDTFLHISKVQHQNILKEPKVKHTHAE